ncbi:MAG: ABC transporter substrate-binding protein [Pseudomonadota bacterium]|nr:ABC transporter substrate-binding protein [Pseudomonadota bacterium]
MRHACAFLAGLLLSIAGLYPAHAETVIGVAGPMTGQFSALGEQLRRGAEMAVSDINAAGGINGEMLKLEVADDACDPDQAATAAADLAVLGAVAVVGHSCPEAMQRTGQVLQEHGIVRLSPASGEADPAAESPGTFYLSGQNSLQGKIAGDWIAATYANKRLAIIHDRSPAGKSLADGARKALRDHKLRERIQETYTPDSADYPALVARLKQSRIDVLYVGGTAADAGLIAKQARGQGVNAIVVGGSVLAENTYAEAAGPAAEGTIATAAADMRTAEEAATVVQAFRAAGFEPEGYTLQAYAAVQAQAEAARKAGGIPAPAVAPVPDTPSPGLTIEAPDLPDSPGEISGLQAPTLETSLPPAEPEIPQSAALAGLATALQAGPFRTIIGDVMFDNQGINTNQTFRLYRWTGGKLTFLADPPAPKAAPETAPAAEQAPAE